MKPKRKVILRCCCLVVCLCLCLCGCGKSATSGRKDTLPDDRQSFEDGAVPTGTVCENARYLLTWDAESKQVYFTDKVTGKVYGAIPEAARTKRVDAEGNEILNNPQIESPLIVYYYNKQSMTENTLMGKTGAIDEGEVITQAIDGGLRVIYRFTTPTISVPVEYTLAEDCFRITVHPDQISDDGVNYVTGVALAPFLCGLSNSAQNDSYLFLPDGSGALVRPKNLNNVGSQQVLHVYGEDQTVYTHDFTAYTQQVHMPVFGVKDGDSAAVGVITDSAEQAYIAWNVGAATIGYSGVYPFFRIRGYNVIEAPEGYPGSLFQLMVFDRFISEAPLSVSYYTLAGEDANYSGMARVYRDYLLKTGTLKDREVSEPALAVRMLGGYRNLHWIFGVPRWQLDPLTTVSRANDIVKELRGSVDGDILVDLVGFGQSGLDVGKVGGGFRVASKLGKKKAVRSLADYCAANRIDLYMDYDVLAFAKSGNGFSKMTDGAKIPSGQTLYLSSYNYVTHELSYDRHQLTARNLLGDAVEKAVDYAADSGFTGVSLGSLSNTVYSDYGCNNLLAEKMAAQVSGLLTGASKDGGVCTITANDYAAAAGTHVLEAPTASSAYDITDVDVPFYEMVFKGYVSMSGRSINLAANPKRELLRCVEAGISPAYTILDTIGDATGRHETVYPALYGSSWASLRDDVAQTAQTAQKALEKVRGAHIVSHSVEASGLRVTVFDNGVRIATNETEQPVAWGGVTVAALDFAVQEG